MNVRTVMYALENTVAWPVICGCPKKTTLFIAPIVDSAAFVAQTKPPINIATNVECVSLKKLFMIITVKRRNTKRIVPFALKTSSPAEQRSMK